MPAASSLSGQQGKLGSSLSGKHGELGGGLHHKRGEPGRSYLHGKRGGLGSSLHGKRSGLGSIAFNKIKPNLQIDKGIGFVLQQTRKFITLMHYLYTHAMTTLALH